MSVVSRNGGIANFGIGLALKGGVSMLALCAVSAAVPAWAAAETPAKAAEPAVPVLTAEQASPTQAAPAADQTPEEKDIVVTGIRASLASAQSIKRNSDTVVDAITAQDIGALPDRSVTEALQRVPGVAMNRFAGSNDPDHFSVEGSGVVVRGLTFVRSEFNGRDTFSAGVGGQAINFADVPAELLGSVEVYKNTTAEMIEGGLAGTVNLNTRKPFDNKGFHISVDGEGNYGDLEKKWSPTFSGLISDTWDTGIGTVGLLASGSYSRIYSKSNGLNVTNIQTRDNTLAIQANSTSTLTCRNPLPGNTDTTTLPGSQTACGTASTAGPDGLADPIAGTRYAPLGGQFREEDYDRKRTGIALAAQWESLDQRATVTAQFLRTDSTNAWGEHTFESAPDLSEYNTYPAGCQQNTNGPGGTTRAECPTGSLQNYTYDSNGLFEKGLITYPGGAWRGDPRIVATEPVAGGMQQSLSRRQVNERNRVSDYALNFKFKANDHLSFNLDGDYTTAEHDDLDVSVFGSTFADNYLDITGALPTVIPHKPLVTQTNWTAPSVAAQRVAGENDAQYFADRNNEFWRAAMDHIEHSTGHEASVKGDVVYNFNDDGSFLKRFKFGARYADREEVVRYTSYNWGALSEVWSGSNVSFAQVPGNSSLYTFDNFFRGAAAGPPQAYYYNGDLINDYAGAVGFFKTVEQAWAANGATATPWAPAAGRPGVIPGTPYLPSEIQPVSQKTGDAYMMLSFGRDEPLFGGIKLDGNIGLRYVADQVKTSGSIGAPTAAQLGVTDSFAVRCPVPVRGPNDPPPPPPTGICAQGPANYALLQQFATGQTVVSNTVNRYDYFLPSLNLKFSLSKDMLLRFAASRVLTRPDMADLRNYVGVGLASDGITLTSTAGNPYLKPARAWQFDLTYEWYFAHVGQLTVDAFYKDVTGFFYQNQFIRPITSNGVTLGTLVRGPDNYPGHGKIKGVEVAYQQTFDFLPWIFSGLGTQLSYTYLDSKGLPNSFLNGGAPSSVSNVQPGNLPLEQLSKHNVNATVFFEKGPVSLRAAYTWRSRFLLTASDVIFPYFPIYNDAEGHLDASAFFSVTKNIKIGVQAVNLTNTVTKTLQQYDVQGDLGPRSYFISDRRFSFILRGSW